MLFPDFQIIFVPRTGVPLEFFSKQYVFSGIFCCQADPTASMFIGQVNIAPMPTDSAQPVFTENSDIVSIDDNGALSLDPGQRISSTMFVTFDIAASTALPAVQATTSVQLRTGMLYAIAVLRGFSRFYQGRRYLGD